VASVDAAGKSETDAIRALVIVPAYNEAGNIEQALGKLLEVQPHLDVVVIDDGSSDATGTLAKQFPVALITHPCNLGYGAALQTGFRYAEREGYTHVVQFDADGQHLPEDISAILAGFQQNDVDVVIDVAGPSRLTPLEPYTVDYKGNRELMRAASAGRGINHFILVTSLGTGRFGWPAALLNLAYGILFWKRRAELFLIDQVRRTAKRSPEGTESGGIRQFTIIRPAGLERATDNWGETHALQIRPADSIFGGTVSRLQVAQVAVLAALHPDASRNKIFELTTEQGVQQIDPIQQMESVSAQVLS